MSAIVGWAQTVFIWVRLGWPFAVTIFKVISDGKVTAQEIHDAADSLHEEIHKAIEKAMNGKTEIVLWRSKQ